MNPHRIDIEAAVIEWTGVQADDCDTDDLLSVIYAWRDEALADRLLASAAVREGERERVVKFYAAVKNAYDLQCTPLDRRSFGKDKFGQGAYCAHRWWWTVLGGVLRDFDDLAAPSLAAPEGTGEKP